MSTRPIKMLVADDSHAIHRIFQAFVGNYEHPIEFFPAENGRECMALLERDDIDVAFIDVNMPEMSGLEAIDAARQHGHRTFVTLMSPEAGGANAHFARKLRVYEFLRKPFSHADIEAILKTYLRISATMRALVVDDSSSTRQIVQKVLAGSIFNMEVEEASDGETALVKCDSGAFDVVFLDCNMPGLNGIGTLKRLFTREPKPRVIMISAQRNEVREQQAFDLGAAAFLHKPFFPADIDAALHGAFGLKLPQLTTSESHTEPVAGTV
jgi:CheY-like chemotaxis protein